MVASNSTVSPGSSSYRVDVVRGDQGNMFLVVRCEPLATFWRKNQTPLPSEFREAAGGVSCKSVPGPAEAGAGPSPFARLSM